MKSGSTTLWRLLAQHPRVFSCTPKEPQFFSREAVFARGFDWYRQLFAGARADQICGEASTCYSRWPHFGDVPARLAQSLPAARLLYIVRHPVERAYSHYVHLMTERTVRETGPVLDFEKALEELPEILDTSLYLVQIERFLPHYDRSALHVLTLDDLQADPQETMAVVHRFLGLDPLPIDAGSAPRVENRADQRFARVSMHRTIRWIRRHPVFGRLRRLVPVSTRRELAARLRSPEVAARLFERRYETHRARLSPLRPETRRLLLARLERPTRELEAFLGRRLPASWFE
jgi:hypothetical protein